MVNKTKKNRVRFSNNTLKNRSTKNKNKSKKVKVIIVEKKHSDEYMKSKEGEYFDLKDYDTVIKEDCDCYYYVHAYVY